MSHLNNSNSSGDTYIQELHVFWGKCPFCRATNGLYGFALQEHKPRCRFIGAANSYDLMRPNYDKMLNEDDPRLLGLIQNSATLEKREHKLKRVKELASHNAWDDLKELLGLTPEKTDAK